MYISILMLSEHSVNLVQKRYCAVVFHIFYSKQKAKMQNIS